MSEDLNPTEIAVIRRRRIKFVTSLVFVFLVGTVAAWWVVPSQASQLAQIKSSTSAELPLLAATFLKLSTVFRYFWFTLAAGSIVLGALGHFGLLDPLLPLLNGLLFILGALLILVCFTAVFLPTMSMAHALP